MKIFSFVACSLFVSAVSCKPVGSSSESQSSPIQSALPLPQATLANLKITSAHQAASGKLYVQLDYDDPYDPPPAAPAPTWLKNSSWNGFFGDRTGLTRVYSKGGSFGPGNEMNAEFYDTKASSGAVRFVANKEGELTISYNESNSTLQQLSGQQAQALLAEIKQGKIPLLQGPTFRRIEYLLQVKDSNEYILVDSLQPDASYEFNVYIGKPGAMRQVAVENVRRLRDGGTTSILLKDKREIYIPSVMNGNGTPALKKGTGSEVTLSKFGRETILKKLSELKLGLNVDVYKPAYFSISDSLQGR